MENIDHVNRFFWIRIWFSPIVLIQYLVKRLFLMKASKKYVAGQEEFSEDKRYEQFLSCYRKDMFLEDLSFHFFFERKITNHRHIFVVNGNLDWQSVALLNYLIVHFRMPYPRFLLNNILIDSRKLPLHWDLIDTFYGEGDLERAIGSGRSFIMEKSFLDRHSGVAERIRDSHISIIPVFYFRDMNNIWYVSGDEIKSSSMASFRCEAIREKVNLAFAKLEKKVLHLVKESKRRRKMSLKGLFQLD